MTAKILLACAGVFGAGVLLWPATSDYRAHLFEARAQSPDAAKTDAAPQQGRGAPPQNRPAVNVRTASVTRGPLPYISEAVGTVQPIASVAIRSRIDAQIENVLVPDGAAVKAGDVLVKLDSRQVEAQIKQAEAQLAKDRTVLEQAERDVARYSELVSKQTGTQVNLDNARTAAAAARAAILGDQAQIENLNVQLSWYTIKAPISLKAGNIVRSGDSSSTGTLTTIVQTTPIYVLFSVPQRLLTDVREAVKRSDAEVVVTPQGGTRNVKGRVSVIDNAIDSATGTVTVRDTFENADEMLWAGQLCQVRITLRVDPDVVSIPREAVQTGQNGNYVYVIEDGVAKVRTVELGRSQEGRDIVASGLKGGEIVVTDGALALTNGARVDTRSAEVKKGNS
jgi:multidrug efflux system membrane fusion protein